MSTASNINTKSISKALSILKTFTDDSPRQRVSDVASKLGLSVSTVSRHLSTMLDLGFVERNDETGYYSLGIELITLAGIALHTSDVYRHAYPEVHRLALETDLHCFLGIPFKKEIIHLISFGPEDTVDLFTPIGHHHPMFCSAIGKAMLAFMPLKEASAILKDQPLKRYAPDTIVDMNEIEKSLRKIRSQGYATISNELTAGKASIAAPIRDRNRIIVGAISISGSISQLDLAHREKELAQRVMLAADRISGKLGFFPK